MSFFRYPGGKAKLSKLILPRLQHEGITEYIEPFVGGGSICSAILKQDLFPDLKRVWLNDKDIGIQCIWLCVIFNPELLIEKLKEFKPTTKSFYDFKKELIQLDHFPRDFENISKVALKKIAIHQMSYSGLGVKAGGPIGGQLQTSNYKVDCRWSIDSMIKKIMLLHRKFFNLDDPDCGSVDFEDMLVGGPHTMIYLDPPYFVKGSELYRHGFTVQDHIRLANRLQNAEFNWVLSYDDADEIRELYEWACIEEVNANYTIRTARNKNELLIYPKVNECSKSS